MVRIGALIALGLLVAAAAGQERKTGPCAQCYGVRKVTCPDCQGNWRTVDVNVRCTGTDCKGKGYRRCINCRGVGDLNCKDCGGDGKRVIVERVKNGPFIEKKERTIRCTSCVQGKKDCPECQAMAVCTGCNKCMPVRDESQLPSCDKCEAARDAEIARGKAPPPAPPVRLTQGLATCPKCRGSGVEQKKGPCPKCVQGQIPCPACGG